MGDVYYNENDPKAAEWLRELIKARLIPNGHVDQRSIVEVQPSDLAGFVQCHFFAGIGGWAYALQLAGWPNDVPVWSGSCPCQPLSCAGKRAGEMDERHLWPDFYRLIAQCRPATVFGEQVASSDGLEWLDGISLDLEEIGYAIGAADLPAACVGAPHRRQRLFWVANSECGTTERQRLNMGESPGENKSREEKWQRVRPYSRNGSPVGVGQADAKHDGSSSVKQLGTEENARGMQKPKGCRDAISGLGIANGHGCEPRGESSACLGYWDSFEPASCRDGTIRRVPSEPSFFPLADGIPAGMVRIRGYGNAIVPQVAAKFIQAYIESEQRL